MVATKKKAEAVITLGDVAGALKKTYINQRVRVIGAERPVPLAGWGLTTALAVPVTIFDIKRFGSAGLGLVQLTGMFDDGGRAMAFLSANSVVELAPADEAPLAETDGVVDEALVRKYSLEVLSKTAGGRNTLGADPEIFVTHNDGQLLPAFEFLPDHVTALTVPLTSGPYGSDRGGGYQPFWDGYQAEFNVRADYCIAYLVDSIRMGLKKTLADARAKDPTAQLSLKTTMDIPPERLATDDTKYVQFGCTPSLNVYPDESFPEVDSATIPFRSAGGHIHFTHTGDIKEAVKGLDRVLGVICVSLFQKYDDPRRRILYGRAGEYRKTSYGMEYRVLSNAWLCNPIVTNLIYELARRVALLGDWTSWQASEKEVRDCINNCDAEAAHRILKRNINQLHALVRSVPGGVTANEALVKIIFDGVHTALRDPDSLSVNWAIEPGTKLIWAGHAESDTNSLGKGCTRIARTGYFD